MDMSALCGGVAADLDGHGLHGATSDMLGVLALDGPAAACGPAGPHAGDHHHPHAIPDALFPDRPDSLSDLDHLLSGACWLPARSSDTHPLPLHPAEPGFWPEGTQRVDGVCPSTAGGWPGSSDEDRELFMQSLEAFVAGQREGSGRLAANGRLKLPVVGGRALDVCTLYREVVKMGGHGTVTHQKLWGRLRDCCRLPATHTAVSNTLRKHYEKLLLAYEYAHFRGGGGGGGGGSGFPASAVPARASAAECGASDDEHSGMSVNLSSFGRSSDSGPPCDPCAAGATDCGATSQPLPLVSGAGAGAAAAQPAAQPGGAFPPVEHPGRKLAERHQSFEARLAQLPVAGCSWVLLRPTLRLRSAASSEH